MRKLHAYFESMCEARSAAAALSEADCGKAHLDLAGALEYEYSQEISDINGSIRQGEASDNLSALMMGLWSNGLNDKHSLASVPGIVYHGHTDCEEGELKISTSLSVKVPDELVEKAFGIINENGGKIFPSAMVQ